MVKTSQNFKIIFKSYFHSNLFVCIAGMHAVIFFNNELIKAAVSDAFSSLPILFVQIAKTLVEITIFDQ